MFRAMQAMHEEVVSQEPAITATQDKIDPVRDNVRATARQAYGYVHRR